MGRKKIRTDEAFTRFHLWPLKVKVRRTNHPAGKPLEQILVRAGFCSCSKVKSKWPNLR